MKTDLKVEDLVVSEDMKNLPMLAKYDEGIRTMIDQVFAGRVILAPNDRAFDLYIDQTKEKLKFPFISIFPSNGYTRINKNYSASNIGEPINRAAKLYNDLTLKYEGVTPYTQNFYQFMYFNIPYRLDCWSTDRIEALQLVQELVFWLQAQGQIKVIYKDKTLTCNLTVDDTIADNSTYTEYANIGNLYDFTFTITLEAPILRTQNYLNITSSDLELNMKEV